MVGQIAMTDEERIEALAPFGYSPREAAFLCVAALQGGYFLRRQFGQFIGQTSGGSIAALVEKAVAAAHVQVSAYAHKTLVYHVSSRPFYAAIGQVDNRNRRRREPLTTKNKLMGLDFVLEHPGVTYLATEDEKVRHFTNTLKIPISALPARRYRASDRDEWTTRYFVEKYPLFIGADDRVCFCFVDEGLTTASRFETFLAQYQPLLMRLPAFHIVYVSAGLRTPRWVEPTFAHWLSRLAHHATSGSPASRMRRHFAERQRYEAKQLATFDRATLMRFRDERTEFSGPEYDRLFEHWKANGAEALSENPQSGSHLPGPAVGVLSSHLLRSNYDLFGSLTQF